jgi:hypothetical protein
MNIPQFQISSPPVKLNKHGEEATPLIQINNDTSYKQFPKVYDSGDNNQKILLKSPLFTDYNNFIFINRFGIRLPGNMPFPLIATAKLLQLIFAYNKINLFANSNIRVKFLLDSLFNSAPKAAAAKLELIWDKNTPFGAFSTQLLKILLELNKDKELSIKFFVKENLKEWLEANIFRLSEGLNKHGINLKAVEIAIITEDFSSDNEKGDSPKREREDLFSNKIPGKEEIKTDFLWEELWENYYGIWLITSNYRGNFIEFYA